MDQINDNISVLWRHGEKEGFGEWGEAFKVEFIVKMKGFLTS